MAGFDYVETFNPVMKFGTIRIILTITTAFKWLLWEIDVNNTFLNRTITEEVIMYELPDFVDKDYPINVCKLQKLLYELKQASLAWFDKLNDTLLKFGFVKSKANDSYSF